MSSFVKWLIDFGHNFLTWLHNVFISLFQSMFDGFIDFVISVVSLFPPSSDVPAGPVVPVGHTLDLFLTALNWLFPVSYILTVSAFVVSGMLAYFVIAPLARWVKLTT